MLETKKNSSDTLNLFRSLITPINKFPESNQLIIKIKSSGKSNEDCLRNCSFVFFVSVLLSADLERFSVFHMRYLKVDCRMKTA